MLTRDLTLTFMDQMLEAQPVLQSYEITNLWWQMLVILAVSFPERVRYLQQKGIAQLIYMLLTAPYIFLIREMKIRINWTCYDVIRIMNIITN